jgi:hypothetical protein
MQRAGRNAQGRSRRLDNGARQRLAWRHGDHQAQTAFTADERGFDRRATLHQRHQRDDAVVGEIDVIDQVARLIKQAALLEIDRGKMRREQGPVFGRQCG